MRSADCLRPPPSLFEHCRQSIVVLRGSSLGGRGLLRPIAAFSICMLLRGARFLGKDIRIYCCGAIVTGIVILVCVPSALEAVRLRVTVPVGAGLAINVKGNVACH